MGVADVRAVPKQGGLEVIRRLWDLAAASGLLLLTLPILIPAAVLVLVSDGRPVFFGHRRIGRDGKAFRCWKLRTMAVDAEDRLRGNVELDQLHRESGFKLPVEHDPRITPVGRWLRRRYIDEIPQLVNVLRGEMSIVGPRPEQVELVERYRPEHRFRLDVKPGITGPMQVHGRGDLSFSERLAVELDYIENLSLGRDVLIILHTIPVIVRGVGAY